MQLHVSNAAIAHLAVKGTDLLYGARPMKRLIQNALLNPLATLILQVRPLYSDRFVIEFDFVFDYKSGKNSEW